MHSLSLSSAPISLSISLSSALQGLDCAPPLNHLAGLLPAVVILQNSSLPSSQTLFFLSFFALAPMTDWLFSRVETTPTEAGKRDTGRYSSASLS